MPTREICKENRMATTDTSPPIVVNRHHATFDIYIGRGTKWGNLFRMRSEADRPEVIERYRQWLWNEITTGNISEADLLSLAGKRIACSCAPKPCHGDVIVQMFLAYQGGKFGFCGYCLRGTRRCTNGVVLCATCDSQK